MKRSKETCEDIWGDGREYNCANHSERMGFVDLGVEEPNRYPCRECYLKSLGKWDGEEENG